MYYNTANVCNTKGYIQADNTKASQHSYVNCDNEMFTDVFQ